MKLINTVKC